MLAAVAREDADKYASMKGSIKMLHQNVIDEAVLTHPDLVLEFAAKRLSPESLVKAAKAEPFAALKYAHKYLSVESRVEAAANVDVSAGHLRDPLLQQLVGSPTGLQYAKSNLVIPASALGVVPLNSMSSPNPNDRDRFDKQMNDEINKYAKENSAVATPVANSDGLQWASLNDRDRFDNIVNTEFNKAIQFLPLSALLDVIVSDPDLVSRLSPDKRDYLDSSLISAFNLSPDAVEILSAESQEVTKTLLDAFRASPDELELLSPEKYAYVNNELFPPRARGPKMGM